MRKLLTLTGRIELTADNQVSDMTVESIRAQEDDPQHRAWERADAVARMATPFATSGADAVARIDTKLSDTAQPRPDDVTDESAPEPCPEGEDESPLPPHES